MPLWGFVRKLTSHIDSFRAPLQGYSQKQLRKRLKAFHSITNVFQKLAHSLQSCKINSTRIPSSRSRPNYYPLMIACPCHIKGPGCSWKPTVSALECWPAWTQTYHRSLNRSHCTGRPVLLIEVLGLDLWSRFLVRYCHVHDHGRPRRPCHWHSVPSPAEAARSQASCPASFRLWNCWIIPFDGARPWAGCLQYRDDRNKNTRWIRSTHSTRRGGKVELYPPRLLAKLTSIFQIHASLNTSL